jgi:hypothetical protein
MDAPAKALLLGDARDQLSYANLNRALEAGCRSVSAGPGLRGRL